MSIAIPVIMVVVGSSVLFWLLLWLSLLELLRVCVIAVVAVLLL